MRITQILALPLLALALTFGAAQAAEQDFVKPKVGIFRLDWCRIWGAECGKPAADRFCQTKGFTQSNNFEEAVDIGASTPTVVIGTGQQCAAPTCDGFTFVTCEKPDAPPPPPAPPPGGGGSGASEKTYNKPKLGGYRVNYCETKGIGCGQDAADAFCDAKGYDDAADFEQSSPVPPGAKPPRFIGNGKICKGPGCYAFNSITCERQP
jgi:hypothetical protein